MGTIGGNLLQATRCWYWRLAFPCRLHGGDRCHAREGSTASTRSSRNELLRLGAPVRPGRGPARARRDGADRPPRAPARRALPAAGRGDRDLTTLEPDELILELDVPRPTSSVYLKAMDRKRWAFALVGVAAARVDGETRVALAGVAPVPWLLDVAGGLDEATPLPGTAYKVEIARALVRARAAPL